MAAFLDRRLLPQDQEMFLEHASTCFRCLGLLAASVVASPGEPDQEPAPEARERMLRTFRRSVREERATVLVANFRDLIREAPGDIRDYLEGLGKSIGTLLHETFTYPTPSFTPTPAGTSPTVISPFGKVRFPILFRWELFQQSNNCQLSADQIGWGIHTTRSRILVRNDEWPGESGRQYEWKLDFRKDAHTLAEYRGDFSIVTSEEASRLARIDDRMRTIKPEVDRLTLWGALLEQCGLCAEAVQNYLRGHLIAPSAGLAYRIAFCFDRFGLLQLRDRWNQEILERDTF